MASCILVRGQNYIVTSQVTTTTGPHHVSQLYNVNKQLMKEMMTDIMAEVDKLM